MYRSFLIGFVSPLSPNRPWIIRAKPMVLGLVRTVYFLIRDIPGDSVSIILQLRLLTNIMPPFQ